jgi:hypothetical protein
MLIPIVHMEVVVVVVRMKDQEAMGKMSSLRRLF